MGMEERHIDAVFGVLSSGAPHPAADTDTRLIQQSWLRCAQNYGLDPSLRPRVHVETAQRLRESREMNGDYMRIARDGMAQLHRHVAELGYVLLLTDAEGTTIDYMGDGFLDTSLRRAGLTLGAKWSEAIAGTNGIGTCLAEGRSLTCHRDDHFYIGHIGLSCTAIPLHDPAGQLMGVLDVSALSSPAQRESQHLVRHITGLYGRMIEDAIFMDLFRDRWIIRLGPQNKLAPICGELLLACDRDGVIVGANADARNDLERASGPEGLIVGHGLRDVFDDNMDAFFPLAKGRTDGRAAVATVSRRAYAVTMVAPRIASAARGTPRAAAPPSNPLAALAGRDPHMAKLTERAARLVDKPISLLIQGETGTGKEVLAKALHQASARAARPFVAVNCAAIPESLIEGELFGYMPGTFTGARSQGRKGLIEHSDGGTLFLDEIGDMPLSLQTRLLRVLSEGEIHPLGAERPRPVALSVVSASHRDLREEVAAGRFREDLYYRLSGACLFLPPLRERADTADLVMRILREEAAAAEMDVALSEDALACLLAYSWPGNIRELRHAVRYGVVMAEDDLIEVHHLPDVIARPFTTAASSQRRTVSTVGNADAADEPAQDEPSVERAAIVAALRRHGWNVAATARSLAISRSTLYRHMQRLDIVSPRLTA